MRISVRTLLLASLLTSNAFAASYAIYDEALNSGWNDYSFSATSNRTFTPGQSGTYAISVNITGGYGALYLAHNNMDVSAYANFTFWINGGPVGGQKLQLRCRLNGAEQTPYQIPTPAANTWTKISVPFSQVGIANATNFNGMTIQDNGGPINRVFYVDNIVLEDSNGTPPPPPPNGTMLYDDALTNGWLNYSFFGNYNFSETTPVQSGSNAIGATYTQAYAGLYLHNNTKVNTSTYASVSFWINGGATGGQNLQIKMRLNDVEQTPVILTPAPAANTWQQVTIPLSSLGVANATTLDGFLIQDNSGAVQSKFYVDNIMLVNGTVAGQVSTPVISPAGGTFTSAQQVTITSDAGATIRYTTDGSSPTSTTGTVYSGAFTIGQSQVVKAIAYASGLTDSNVASATFIINLPTVSGFDIYADALQNGWDNWSFNGTFSLTNNSPVQAGSASIGATLTQANAAIYLHHSAMDTSPFQNLVFWINGGASGGQKLQVKARLNGVDQTPYPLANLTANTWAQITIPLASLGADNKLNLDGILIQDAGNQAWPVFYVDSMVLTYAPPPATITLSVDAATPIRTLPGLIHGYNFSAYDSQIGTTATRTLLNVIGAQILRFPGGSVGDKFDWSTNKDVSNNLAYQTSFPMFAATVEAAGAQAILIANYGSGTPEQASAWVAYCNGSSSNANALGVDSKGRDWKTVGFWAALRGAAPLGQDDGYNFLRANHAAPYQVKYWEIGNECWGKTWEYDTHGQAGSGLAGIDHDPGTYANAFKQFQTKMKAVDATIKVGAVALTGQDDFQSSTTVTNPADNSQHSGWSAVLLNTLKALAVTPDFLSWHRYPNAPGTESDAGLLQVSSGWGNDASNLRKLLSDYLGGSGAGVQLFATEQNFVYSNPGKQTTSLVGGLFYADSIGQVAKTEFAASMWWAFHNAPDNSGNNSASLYGWRNFGDYGIVSSSVVDQYTQIDTPYPTYQAAKLLTHWARGGDQIVAANTNYSMLAVYAAKTNGGKLALLVINKSATDDLTASLAISGFTPTAAGNVFHYGKPEDNAAKIGDTVHNIVVQDSISNAGATFNYTFPSYSMSVVELAPTATQQTVATPLITPNGGSFSAPVQVSLACVTNGANIRYTTDGSTPTSTTGTLYAGQFTLNASAVVNAIAYEAGYIDSAVATASFTINIPPGTVATPVIAPNGGTFSAPVQVTLSCATNNATIRYTTDGNPPTSSSGTIYSGAFTLSSSATVQAIAYLSGMNDSAVAVATFTFVTPPPTVAVPVITPNGGTFNAPVQVTISTTTSNANIRYTIDGSIPTSTTGIVYSGAFTLNSSATINAIAYLAGMLDSSVSSAVFTITAPQPTVDAPTISPNGGAFTAPVKVTLSTTTPGALIRYSVDGSVPALSTALGYIEPFTLNSSATVRAIAYKAGSLDSAEASAVFTITISTSNPPPSTTATPVITPNGGTFAGSAAVAITCATANSGIRYTLNGAAPTASSGTLYTGPFSVTASTTVKAIAFASGFLDSAVASSTFTLDAPPVVGSAPTFSATTVDAGQTVTVNVTGSDPEGHAVTPTFNWGDGTPPTSSNSHIYATPGTFTVSVSLSDGTNTISAGSAAVTVLGSTSFSISKFTGSFKPGVNKDSCTIAGTLPSVPAMKFADKTFILDAGGAKVEFKLDAKGKAKSGSSTLTLKPKLTKNPTTKLKEFAGGSLPFTATLKGSYISAWSDEGISLTAGATKQPIQMTVKVTLDGQNFTAAGASILNSKPGKGGSFK